MNAVAVVTGAASGIGRATALRLARDGFDVAMVDLDAVGLDATDDQIKAFGGLARAFVVDLCDPLAVGSIVREIAVTSGAPEVLVNVAGIGVAATPVGVLRSSRTPSAATTATTDATATIRPRRWGNRRLG